MARLSKSHHFQIYEDTGFPTPPPDENDPFNDTPKLRRDSLAPSAPNTPSSGSRRLTANDPPSDADNDNDEDERPLPRDSLTSVSTYPDSLSQQNDYDYAPPSASPTKFFTPRIIRPSFRRPESVRRMQMSSPRQSLLSHHRSSRPGTPRSEFGRESPRARRRVKEEWATEDEDEGALTKKKVVEEEKEHPLVLLHVTLLPIVMPWSTESMQEILPAQVLENLSLLRSKVSDTVLQRGILIPHPREEYEMLEERLLEALELREERLTQCGHFRGRMSGSSTESDSGIGSSDDDGDVCETCKHHIHCRVGKKQTWSVKVFAANGLMRASAWAAAWEGMESVDVEILPWVGEDERRKLDRGKEEEEREWFAERERARGDLVLLEEREAGEMLMLQEKEAALVEAVQEAREEEDSHPTQHLTPSSTEPSGPIQHQAQPPPQNARADDLPSIYRGSQVPLSALLRNYFFLLAQDRRNVAIFFLGILAFFFAVRAVPGGTEAASADVTAVPEQLVPLTVVGDDASGVKMAQQGQETLSVLGVPDAVGAELGGDGEVEVESLIDSPFDFEFKAQAEESEDQSEGILDDEFEPGEHVGSVSEGFADAGEL